jgi:hypothetical protein
VLSIRREQIDRIELSEARWIEVAAHGLLVGEHNDNFFVRRGWGAIFQNSENPVRDGVNLPIGKMYVMLSAFSCQPIVFIRVRPRSAAR